MTHPKRKRRHELASWWLPAPSDGAAHEAPADKDDMDVDPVSNEKCELNKLNDLNKSKQSETTVHTLKEGENYLTLNFGDLCISIVHGSVCNDAVNDVGEASGEKIKAEHDSNDNNSSLPHALAVPLLCIDVDNTTKSVAVKDIRDSRNRNESSQQQYNDDKSIEFFLARRKRLRETKQHGEHHTHSNNTKQHTPINEMVDETKGGGVTSASMSSSGYTTDDEKEEDGHEEVSPSHSKKEVQDESDVDSQGNALYESAERLPRRQLRVLGDGDRILMRFTPKIDSIPSSNDVVHLAKLEYIYQKKSHPKPLVETTKPRLLSVKSDVKSYKFKTNDTSAAEAPSDDISVLATKEGEGNYNTHAKQSNHGRPSVAGVAANVNYPTGKDWSAVASANEAPAAPKKGEEDDDNMEEYSYLTGEIVMKDQDYISALTGDEGPNVIPYKREKEDGGGNGADAATASAVVLKRGDTAVAAATATSPKCKVSFDAKFSPEKKSESLQIEETKHHEQEEVFLTARSNEEHSKESSEEEFDLLSQPSKDDNNQDDETDISQTQSLPVYAKMRFDQPRNQDSASLSGVEEHDDESTTDSPAMPSQVQVGDVDEKVQSQLTLGSKVGEDQSDDEAYHAATQFDGPIADVGNNDNSEQSGDEEEEYNAETQFVGVVMPATLPNVEEESIGDKVNEEVAKTEISRGAGEAELKSEEVVGQNTSDENAAKRCRDVGESESAKDAMSGSHSKPPPAAKSSTPKRSDQFASTPTKFNTPKRTPAYENTGLLSNDTIHRIQNGAMMTGSVGGANLGLAMFQGGTDRDLLTSIALQSTPNNLPEAAMSHKSSEETTVVNDKGTKDFANNSENRKNTKAENVHSSDHNNHANGSVQRSTGKDAKDSQVPSEVFVEKVRERRSSRSASKAASTPRQRPKRNRRGASTPSGNADEEIRVMFTGIDVSTDHKKMIQSIGAELVESLEQASTATHVIASDGKSKLRRTPKLMICICNTSNILSLDWLEQSASQQKILDPKDFLVLGDKAAEATYNFSMKETLDNGDAARRDGGVLGGYSVYICNGVADNNAPPLKALQLIVKAAGGEVLKSLSKAGDPTNTIILTSDPGTEAQLSERGVERVANLGAKILTTSWLFHTIITQQFSTVTSSSASPAKSKSRSKRKAETTTPPPSSRKRRSSRR